MAGIGHNSGRVDEPGQSWRKHVWTKARKDLLPTLPIEIVRRRVKRAAELGLPYRTYAGIRASNGHDLIGFLFSSNALRVLRAGQKMPQDRADKMHMLRDVRRVGAAQSPLRPAQLALMSGIDDAIIAPRFTDSWSAMRETIRSQLPAPADRFVVVGDTAFEREWSEAAAMAGYLVADEYFAPGMG
ncbi:hypothetical protein [Yoonia sediminilitoris]|uniref:Uncharacterized protein n=1 Tax=Yoonia sediminilitoris TaxID=1286148 RepID=A0A2T6KQF7_9RHOB|nr:hypothetical protein [Yoonia sediminilitoris]PUB18794.1 hypothetical protein C8N45_101381 [Yoonia sediminilitoris]RCW98962.1 hypothetical protein DFP92_101381 [Yoonia sediminilitoris]